MLGLKFLSFFHNALFKNLKVVVQREFLIIGVHFSISKMSSLSYVCTCKLGLMYCVGAQMTQMGMDVGRDGVSQGTTVNHILFDYRLNTNGKSFVKVMYVSVYIRESYKGS